MSVTKQCISCFQEFACSNTAGNCWCMNYPHVLAMQNNIDCLCEACLKCKIVDQIDAYCTTISPLNALEKRVEYLPKMDKLIENIDYNIENGLYIFTKWFHLKRGICCKNGCRHCPYGYKK